MQVEVIEVKPVPPPKEYLLRVNQNEINLLSRVLGRIGGYDGMNGWKVLVEKMFYPLDELCTLPQRETPLDDNGYIKDNPPVKPQ